LINTTISGIILLMSELGKGYIEGRKKGDSASVVVYGLDPIPGQLDRTLGTLAETGDVFTYEYPIKRVISTELNSLPNLMEEIKLDVQDKTEGISKDRITMVGASLGALIAYRVQLELGLTSPGLYTSAGVNVARNTMFNPVFFKARELFREYGIGYSAVASAWEAVDFFRDRPAPPEIPFVGHISRVDPVVPYPFANRNLQSWQEQGSRIEILRSNAVGHTGSINFFDENIREIIDIGALKPGYSRY
jgi:hypothetical protein